MSDTEELYQAMRDHKRTAKLARSKDAHAFLDKTGLDYIEKNGGSHLVLCTEPEIDFWPSSQRWIERGGCFSGRGIQSLRRHLVMTEQLLSHVVLYD